METSSLIILIFLLFCTAFASASEMAIATVNRIRIKSRIESGDKKAIRIMHLIEKRDRSITTIVVLNNIVNITIPTLSAVIFTQFFENYGALISAVLMTILILIFGEILPKLFGNKYSEEYLNAASGLIAFVIKIMTPIAFPFFLINNFVDRQLNKNVDPNKVDLIEVEDEILTMIEESSLEGKIEVSEELLIRNAIEFNDIRVEEIFQPKRNVFMLNVNSTNECMLEQMLDMRFSRIPVYEEDKDHIIGIISEREFLSNYIENKSFDVKTIIRECKFIPDTMKISTLLPQLQNTKSQMAIVIDERATVQGIITVEDIVEEIVGEIWDEHDDVVHEFRQIDEYTYEISGEMTINDFNDLYEIKDISSEQLESTVAGYVIELAEKIPETSETFEDNDFSYTISHVDGNKIEKIIVKLRAEVIESLLKTDE